MTPLFWIAIVVDAVLALVLLVLTLSGNDLPDGGRGMVVLFSIIVPAVIVSGGAWLFLKSRSPALRVVALLVVAGPGLLIAATRLRGAVIDAHVRRTAEGGGYFSGREAQAGEAVVRRDAAALRALGKSVDVNAKGKDGMTLMELAVTRADDSTAHAGAAGASLDVVRELMALGADPNAGLKVATKLPDIATLSALLDGGAKPGFADEHGPVVFSWLNVMPLAGATALLDHQLDPNITDNDGVPLVVAAAQQDRWNIVWLLLDRGADPSRTDRRGTGLADVVQSRIESSTPRPPEMMAEIARVNARLRR